MLTVSCPSCGAELKFSSAATVYAVCAYCGSTVVRTDTAVEAIGKMATLPDDISPIQVGTRLTFDNRRFTVLGRTRMGWADGAWTEWFMDDGAGQSWLIEAQGFFSVAFEQPLPPELLTAPWPALGADITLGDTTFRVTDLKEAHCIGSEGELPFRAPAGLTVHYADLASRDSGFMGLEDAEDGRRLYRGVNVHFDELRFDNLRPVDGWTPPQPGAAHAGDPEYPPSS